MGLYRLIQVRQNLELRKLEKNSLIATTNYMVSNKSALTQLRLQISANNISLQ